MTTMIQQLKDVPIAGKAGLAFGLAVLLAGTMAAIWWLALPKQNVLFTDLRETDAAEISAKLEEWKVPFEFQDDGGTLIVADDAVYPTRMRLVSEGIPTGGSVGFELFKDADFGVTEFAQRINFQRALQGELERTIAAFAEVESARVHLNIRRSNGLLRDQAPSRASVALRLLPGAELDRNQIGGIQNLIAAAVEGLSISDVVVLDERGNVLSRQAEAQADAMRNDEQTRLEARIQSRISDLLGSLYDASQFRVSVDVQLNFDRIRQVHERVLPSGPDGSGVVIRERSSKPGADGAGDRASTGATAATGSEVEYAHGRESEEIAFAQGRIERVSVAVVVPPGLDEAAMLQLETLISASAGLSAERGDRIELAALDIGGAPHPASSSASTEVLVEASDDAAIGARERVAAPAASALNWWLLTLAAAAGATFGGLLLRWLRPRRRRLSIQQREQALLQIRAWLDQGDTSP